VSAVVLSGGRVLVSGGNVFAVGGGGATPVFNFANFSGSPALHFNGVAAVNSGVLDIVTGVSHNDGSFWYTTPQNIQAFTTSFSFQIPPFATTPSSNYGLVFAIQNTTNTTNPGNFGLGSGGYSANGIGYGAGGGAQPAMANSVGLVFSTSAFNGIGFVSPGLNSTIILAVDGGPQIGSGSFAPTDPNGFAAAVDVHPFGFNFANGDTINCNVTYDGTTLTLVVTDTVALVTTRLSWPVNIPAIVGANTALIGFTAGSPVTTNLPTQIFNWAYSTGINTRLASPTFSVTPGQYTSTQSVSLSGPAGASIYYTLDGTPPAASSTLYSGTPISVSATEVISAVAIESNFTDSFVSQALYRIQGSSTPTINFASGFSSVNGVIQAVGNATISGGKINLTDTTNTAEAAAAWFDVPVPISTFSTTFTLNTASISGSNNGICFVVQNYPQTTTGTNLNWNLGVGPFGVTVVSGGPWTLSSIGPNLGYTQIFSSVGVCFNLNGNSVGLYTNGAAPTGSQTSITGGVSFSTATAIVVTIAYNGTALTLAMTQGANTFNLTLSSSINIPSIVGASNAWVGFTAGTDQFAFSTMSISNWTM
jgi:Chitobiase/beta-hexosaminidase C-terminal domain/Legume lectin domain